MEISIIIPTFNEAQNLTILIPRIFEIMNQNGLKAQVIVVDDNSPDGTWEIAQNLAHSFNLKLVRRFDERGLSSAVLEGFRHAQGEILTVMDADLSHPPEKIPEMVKLIEAGFADMVIGSRYVEGGEFKNWPPFRRFISKCATGMAKIVCDIKDPITGFFSLKKKILNGIELNPKGFKISLEILVRCNLKKVIEIPITFTDRKFGESKLNQRVILDYIFHLLALFFYKNPSILQFLKFCVVGTSGIFVNLLFYTLMIYLFKVNYLVAATVSFCIAASSNYYFNLNWTFHKSLPFPRWQSYIKFFSVSLMGYAINILVLYIMVEKFGLYKLISQAIAIIIATSNNFLGSKVWAFKSRFQTPKLKTESGHEQLAQSSRLKGERIEIS